MVTAKQAFASALEILKTNNIDDALHNARLLFHHVTNLDYRLIPLTYELTDNCAKRLYDLCHRRAKHEPLQYILGTWQFMNIELKVGEGVLIPRSDSECVCLAAIEKLASIKQPIVLDLCAGSGALGLAIKDFVPDAAVSAVELSDKAFLYLKQNSRENIQCVKCDVNNYFTSLSDNSINLIISNPPYISKAEMCTLEPELSFEPEMALTDNSDGLTFYRLIAQKYYSCVAPYGWLVFEIGYAQANAVTQICKENGWQNISIKNDMEDRARVVLAQKVIDSI